MANDNIYPDLSNSKHDIGYVPALVVPSDVLPVAVVNQTTTTIGIPAEVIIEDTSTIKGLYSFTNGLIETGNIAKLGGTLTGNTTIDTANRSFSVEGTNGGSIFLQDSLFSSYYRVKATKDTITSHIELFSDGTYGASYGRIQLYDSSDGSDCGVFLSSTEIMLSFDIAGTNVQKIHLDASGIILEPQSSSKAIVIKNLPNLTTQDRLIGQYGTSEQIGYITLGIGLSLSSGELSATGDAESGFWTPTLTNTTNLSASTAFSCQYMRVGFVVTCSGKVTVDPTATGLCELSMDIPIASVISAEEELAGTAVCAEVAGMCAAIKGGATSDNAILTWTAVDTASRDFYFHFTYCIGLP